MRITLHQKEIHSVMPVEPLKLHRFSQYPIFKNEELIRFSLRRFHAEGDFLMSVKSAEARHLFRLLKDKGTSEQDLDYFFFDLIQKHATPEQFKEFTLEGIQKAFGVGYKAGAEQKMSEIQNKIQKVLGLEKNESDDGFPW